MKNRFQRIACALLLASLLAIAAPSEDAYAAIVVNGKDDISNSCAQPTPYSGLMGDEINFWGDVDCLKWTITGVGAGNYGVTVWGDLNVDCSVIFTVAGITRMLPDRFPNQPGCSIQGSYYGSQTYTVKVWGYNGFFNSTKAYTITISV